MDSDGMVILDGADGEGGGQILRSALTLSMLTNRPFCIKRIRANRDKPGLRPQHLAAVEASAILCQAEVSGASVGSREITFRPGQIQTYDLDYAIGTAGSTALVLQTLHLPIALKTERTVRVSISGGTFNTKAPSFPFLANCWSRHLDAIGLPISLSMPIAGFYPRGGGRVDAWIEPGAPRPLTRMHRGPLKYIRGVAGVCKLQHNDIAERMRDRVESLLSEVVNDVKIDLVEWPGATPGVAIVLTAEYLNGHATFIGLGERGKPSEIVAEEVAGELLEHHDNRGSLDPYSADQLLIPLAFANGRSEFSVSETTEHLRTNARTISMFLERKIRIQDAQVEGEPGRVIIG